MNNLRFSLKNIIIYAVKSNYVPAVGSEIALALESDKHGLASRSYEVVDIHAQYVLNDTVITVTLEAVSR